VPKKVLRELLTVEERQAVEVDGCPLVLKLKFPEKSVATQVYERLRERLAATEEIVLNNIEKSGKGIAAT
jgi:hypothetical protein